MLPLIAEKCTRVALFQEHYPENVVRCLLCPHRCILQDDQHGICRTRINKNGVLYTLAYGNPCSLAVDPIEKKPLFHFLPGTGIFSIATNGCNFRCLNCQNWTISQSKPNESVPVVVLPEELVGQALTLQTQSIAFTYTEPTVFYEYVLETAKIAHREGLKTVLISNGYINNEPLLELCPFLDAANIDLKCFDEKTYHLLTGGSLQPVLESLKTIKDQGVWLEITNLLVPEFSDGSDSIKAMCDWLVENGFEDTPLHFSRFFPAYKLHDLTATSEQSLLRAKKIAVEAGMKYVYIGNIPGLQGENTYCPNCRYLLIERSFYAIIQNLLHDGCCAFCGTRIPGVWV